jgi:hypothetical protein
MLPDVQVERTQCEDIDAFCEHVVRSVLPLLDPVAPRLRCGRSISRKQDFDGVDLADGSQLRSMIAAHRSSTDERRRNASLMFQVSTSAGSEIAWLSTGDILTLSISWRDLIDKQHTDATLWPDLAERLRAGVRKNVIGAMDVFYDELDSGGEPVAIRTFTDYFMQSFLRGTFGRVAPDGGSDASEAVSPFRHRTLRDQDRLQASLTVLGAALIAYRSEPLEFDPPYGRSDEADGLCRSFVRDRVATGASDVVAALAGIGVHNDQLMAKCGVTTEW